MVFEYLPSKEFTLLEALASFLGSKMQGGIIQIPENIGKGYVKGYKLGSSLKMMIHRCILKEDLIIKRIAVNELNYGITFTFHAILPEAVERISHNMHPGHRYKQFPSVQITSANIDYEILFPANTSICTIIIVTTLSDLTNLLDQNEEHQLLQHMLLKDKPYFYEEILSPEMEEVAVEIFGATIPQQLNQLFHKVKAQELIYLIFIELLKRQDLRTYPLNAADVRFAHLIKDKIIEDLSIVPNLPDLARLAGMSESKLKRLFKQIFGNSIYDYYQTLRMKEAAYLIKEKKFSVAEAGYSMGFTNLSHFSRLFERYIGLKPKKYSAAR